MIKMVNPILKMSLVMSISHENHYAVAFVVIENNDPNQ